MSSFADIVSAIQKISPTGIDEWKVIEKIHKNPTANIQDILIQSLMEHIRIQKNEMNLLKGEKIEFKDVYTPISIQKTEEPPHIIEEAKIPTPKLIDTPQTPKESEVIQKKESTWRNARKIDVQALFQKTESKIEPPVKEEEVTIQKKDEPEENIEIQGDTNLIQQIMEMGPYENYQDYQRKYVSKILKELEKMCHMALQDKKLNEFREIGQIGRESISLSQLVDNLFTESHKLVRFWEIYNDNKDYRLSKIGMDLFVFILENVEMKEYLSLLTPQLLDTYEYLS